MSRQGARISLAPVILAVVFPAIIGAAVALAYYGYRYAVAASVRSKASLMEGNQQLANLLTEQVQDRIDKADGELFDQLEWDDTAAAPPAHVDLPPGVESVALLDEALKIRSLYPTAEASRKRREMDRWQSYVRGLDWKSLHPWTPEHPGNFRHLHQLFEGRSVLIAYAAKKTAGGDAYYVAAKLDLPLIEKEWIPEEMDAVAGNRRVAILDEVARSIYRRAPAPDAVPVRGLVRQDALRLAHPDHAQQRRRAARPGRDRAPAGRPPDAGLDGDHRGGPGRRLAGGAGRAARLAAEERLHRQRLARAEDAAVAHPHVRRDAGRPGSTRARTKAREYGEIITRESERLAHLIDNVLDFARIERGKAGYEFAEGRPRRGGGARARRLPLPPGQGEAAACARRSSRGCRRCAWTRTR